MVSIASHGLHVPPVFVGFLFVAKPAVLCAEHFGFVGYFSASFTFGRFAKIRWTYPA
jgi:hypothetical protein